MTTKQSSRGDYAGRISNKFLDRLIESLYDPRSQGIIANGRASLIDKSRVTNNKQQQYVDQIKLQKALLKALGSPAYKDKTPLRSPVGKSIATIFPRQSKSAEANGNFNYVQPKPDTQPKPIIKPVEVSSKSNHIAMAANSPGKGYKPPVMQYLPSFS